MILKQFQTIEANYRAGFYADASIVGQLIEEVKRLQAEIDDLAYASGEAADTIHRLENQVERLQAVEQAARRYLNCPPAGPEVTLAFYALCEVCGVDPNKALGI